MEWPLLPLAYVAKNRKPGFDVRAFFVLPSQPRNRIAGKSKIHQYVGVEKQGKNGPVVHEWTYLYDCGQIDFPRTSQYQPVSLLVRILPMG